MKKIILIQLVLLLAWNATMAQGTFTDSRDSNEYKTVKIGTQVWMAENLFFKPAEGAFWLFEENNSKNYGYLYNWETAQNVCPEGWHLPSTEEFKALETAAGVDRKVVFAAIIPSGKTGFNVLNAGSYDAEDQKIKRTGMDFCFWMSTEVDSEKAWQFVGMDHYKISAQVKHHEKANGASVRCIKD